MVPVAKQRCSLPQLKKNVKAASPLTTHFSQSHSTHSEKLKSPPKKLLYCDPNPIAVTSEIIITVLFLGQHHLNSAQDSELAFYFSILHFRAS